jgi:hypothetical protein
MNTAKEVHQHVAGVLNRQPGVAALFDRDHDVERPRRYDVWQVSKDGSTDCEEEAAQAQPSIRPRRACVG